MEMEYKDTNRRGKFVIIVGVVLAIAAGAASFYLINQAQQTAGQGDLQKARSSSRCRSSPPARPILAAALEVREIVLDEASQVGIVKDPKELVGKVLAIPVAIGQPIYSNMIALTASGPGGIEILGPDETIAPDSVAWRAISITIPDERAVAGMLAPGQTIDIFMTAQMNVSDPEGRLHLRHGHEDHLPGHGHPRPRRHAVHPPRLARGGRGDQPPARHRHGPVQRRAAALQDVRFVDVSDLGATTSRILEKYGLPFPAVYPRPDSPIPPQPPLRLPTPPPTPAAPPTPTPAARGLSRPVAS